MHSGAKAVVGLSIFWSRCASYVGNWEVFVFQTRSIETVFNIMKNGAATKKNRKPANEEPASNQIYWSNTTALLSASNHVK